MPNEAVKVEWIQALRCALLRFELEIKWKEAQKNIQKSHAKKAEKDAVRMREMREAQRRDASRGKQSALREKYARIKKQQQ